MRTTTKKKAATKKRKSSGASDTREAVLKRMRDKRDQLQNKADNRGGGGGNNIFDELDYGKNMRRILPPKNLSPEFYKEADVHFRVGPNSRTVRCIGLDKGCPVCKRFEKEVAAINRKYPRNSEEGRIAWAKAAEKYKAKTRYYMNTWTKENGARVLSCGDQIMGPLMNNFFDDDLSGDFTDPETGSMIRIDKKGDPKKKRRTQYEVHFPNRPRRLRNWKTISKDLPDLDKAIGAFLTPAQINAILDGRDDEDDDTEDADIDEVDESEFEDDDDADLDDDDDYGDSSDDDDDEDDRPRSRTKKKLRTKSKRATKRRR